MVAVPGFSNLWYRRPFLLEKGFNPGIEQSGRCLLVYDPTIPR
jgi:hypothetical protein